MNCPICALEMVKAQATNFGDFYMYCRGCKKEMAELLKVTVASPSAKAALLPRRGFVALLPDHGSLPDGFWQAADDWNAIARQVGMDLAKKTKWLPSPPDRGLL